MTVFTLPTKGPATYRGKYPTRVRSCSFTRETGLHLELNNGTRLWTFAPAHIPKTGYDTAPLLAKAVPMSDSNYAELRKAAGLLRGRVGMAGRSRRERLEKQVADICRAIVPEAPAPVRLVQTRGPDGQSVLVRRDNVEYHAGQAAYREAANACPYSAGGERAARWNLGWLEAAKESVA